MEYYLEFVILVYACHYLYQFFITRPWFLDARTNDII